MEEQFSGPSRPFDLHNKSRQASFVPMQYSSLSPEQFDAEIEKGFEDLRAGRVVSSDQVRATMQERYLQ
ncbi:MAG: hypothetical protein FWD65_07185 [Coriobacteriia bacterium]|nr:hypothetical protein [Coriobacteriia bacterium]